VQNGLVTDAVELLTIYCLIFNSAHLFPGVVGSVLCLKKMLLRVY